MNNESPQIYFHHVAMDISNYEECFNFYIGMGLKSYCEWIWKEDTGKYKKGGRNCFLTDGLIPCIELHENPNAKTSSGVINHFCFHVNDIGAMYKKAISLGAKEYRQIRSVSLDCSPKPLLNVQAADLIGPASENIELICWHGYTPY